MRNRFTIFIAFLLVFSTIAPVVSAAPESGEDENWSNGPGEATEWDRHGVDLQKYYKLWSGDVDVGENDPRVPQSTEGLTRNEINARALAYTTDRVFKSPPKKALNKWNLGESRSDVKVKTSEDSSVAPLGVNPSDKAFVKNAYITDFAFMPTKVISHYKKGDTVTYVPTNGKVITAVDFEEKQTLPESYSSPTDLPGSAVSSSIGSSEVGTVKIQYQNNRYQWITVGKKKSGTGRITRVPYDRIPANTKGIRLVAEIETTINHQRRVCDDSSGSSSNSELSERNQRLKRQLKQITGDGTSSGSSSSINDDDCDLESFDINRVDVVTQQLDARSSRMYTQIHAIDYPNSEKKYGFKVRASTKKTGARVARPVSNIYIESVGSISTNFDYYVKRDESWDKLKRYNGDDEKTIASSTHPLELHIFPSHTTAYQVNGDDSVRFKGISGETYKPPQLSENINVPVKQEPYTYVNWFSFVADTKINTAKVKTIDITGTQSAFEKIDLKPPSKDLTDLRQVTIRSNISRYNKTHSKVEVKILFNGVPMTFRRGGGDTGERLNRDITNIGPRNDERALPDSRIVINGYYNDTTIHEKNVYYIPESDARNGIVIQFKSEDWSETDGMRRYYYMDESKQVQDISFVLDWIFVFGRIGLAMSMLYYIFYLLSVTSPLMQPLPKLTVIYKRAFGLLWPF